MKKMILCTLVLSLAACKSTDVRNIADSVSDIAGIASTGTSGGTSGSSSIPTYEHQTQQYSNSSEPFYISDNTKMSPERGAIRSITQEKNPKGMTMVRVLAYHQDSGAAMESNTYFYKVDGNGWLSDVPLAMFRPETIDINSGVYYLKAQSDTGKFYTSGMITLARGVTNVVSIELQ
ncbi:hypothetical protein [Shewanella baltica]|uniref:hypothetical protein n=2 Tax=Shewanellaceae TaxID=267890 RepID=UPI000903831E|nr:hypothetical protein [Shewanella baltica]AVT48136.1 hypothetical protein C8I07_10520 [Shewanella baltica]OUS50629.1 hypothetical protein BM607_017950 [Shewanella sp. SACH]